MIAIKLIIIAIFSYLLGSLNFGVILSKHLEKDDVRNHGSGNAGTTNMVRSYGKGVGALTIIGDMLKVMVAILIAKLIISANDLYSISFVANDANIVLKSYAGLFCVIGHIFPCYFQFKGGKGVATSGGMVFMIDWRIALILLGIFILTVIITKYVSLGSLIMAVLYPVFIYAFYKGIIISAIALVFTIIVVIAHRENVKRLINHTEHKISLKNKKSS